MLVSIGERDFTDTFGEVGALTKRLSEEREESRSELMRELATGRPRGFGMTASHEEVEAETLEALALGNCDPRRKGPGGGGGRLAEAEVERLTRLRDDPDKGSAEEVGYR